MASLKELFNERRRLRYTLAVSIAVVLGCIIALVAVDLGESARYFTLTAFAGLIGVGYSMWPRRSSDPQEREAEDDLMLNELGYHTEEAPAGWYWEEDAPSGVQRYYDGDAWTKHRRQREVTWRDEHSKVRAISLLIGLVFLVPAAVLTFAGPSVGTYDCGTWLNPTYDSQWQVEQTIDRGFTDSAGDRLGRDLLQAACNEKIDNRRTLVLVLLGIGAVGSFAFTNAIERTRRPVNV